MSSSMTMMRIFTNMMCPALDNLSDYAACLRRLQLGVQLRVPNEIQQKMKCKMTGKEIR